MFLRLTTTALLAITASALAAKPQAAQPAVLAVPAKPAEDAPKPAPLISSEMVGRDFLFLAHALDLGKALTYLAEQTTRTHNPALKGYGDDLVKTLAAQSAVLTTVAEMRNINPPSESPTQKKLSEKLSKLEGPKLQKALLDAFIEVDERFIATYELGAKSPDATISKFVEQTLPEARKHLRVVQGLAGIAPQYVERTATAAPATAETPTVPTPALVNKPATATPPAPFKPAEPATKPAAIAEPPDEVVPKKLESTPAKPNRPAFRTNIPLQN